ncbi:unnamed protein product, partial [Polarella glacialis]
AIEVQKTKVVEEELAVKTNNFERLVEKTYEMKKAHAELQDRIKDVMPKLEHACMQREDWEHRYERIRSNTEDFEAIRTNLEKQLVATKKEKQRLTEYMERSLADAGTQVEACTVASTGMQTDLSYQYLESSDHMQSDAWRRDRLATLKRASNFVADPEERRDFTAQMRNTALPMAQIAANNDLRLERASVPFGSAGRSPGSARSPSEAHRTSPSVPEPWPTGARPPGGAPPAQAVRSSRTQATGLPPHGGIQIAQVKTTGKVGLASAAELQKMNQRSGQTPSPWSRD